LWLNGLLKRTCNQPQAARIKQIWDGMVDDFLNIDFVKKHDSPFNPWDEVDKMQVLLKTSRVLNFNVLAKYAPRVADFLAGRSEGYLEHALAENLAAAKYVVYGHTHHSEMVTMEADKYFFNTGTWRAVHELAKKQEKDQVFGTFHVMTYVAIYRADERGGKPFESWSGALGVE
jgi:hypothetical protein